MGKWTMMALAVLAGAGAVTLIYDRMPMEDASRRQVKDLAKLGGLLAGIALAVA